MASTLVDVADRNVCTTNKNVHERQHGSSAASQGGHAGSVSQMKVPICNVQVIARDLEHAKVGKGELADDHAGAKHARLVQEEPEQRATHDRSDAGHPRGQYPMCILHCILHGGTGLGWLRVGGGGSGAHVVEGERQLKGS